MTTELPDTHPSTPAPVPLALKSNEGLGAWSRSAPTEPGHYWVWQAGDTWPCRRRALRAGGTRSWAHGGLGAIHGLL
jgi:hypothetical protein